MAGRKKNPAQTEATRNTFLQKSYELFCARGIESVTMSEIAKASGYKDMTLYRYYPSKANLIVAVATKQWNHFLEEKIAQRSNRDLSKTTAADDFDYYLESFLDLYKNNRDLLRFNQFFNVYVQSEHIDAGTLRPYKKMIEDFQNMFHNIYMKALKDHTIRTDVPEPKMFGTTLHLMLAAVTRYAVGLVYTPDDMFDAQEELQTQKSALFNEYRNDR